MTHRDKSTTARRQALLDLSNTLSSSHIFDTKEGNGTLGLYLLASQVPVRFRRQEVGECLVDSDVLSGQDTWVARYKENCMVGAFCFRNPMLYGPPKKVL